MSTAWPLKVKLELRAMTNNHLKRDSAVMISSTIPSAKYSCSGSPDMFWNGRTASERLSGSASAAGSPPPPPPPPPPSPAPLPRKAGGGGPRRASDGVGEADAKYPHRAGDVLEALLPEIVESEIEPV